MFQLESNHAERENSSLLNLFVLFSPLVDRIDIHPHWGRAICFLSTDSNVKLIQNHSLGHTEITLNQISGDSMARQVDTKINHHNILLNSAH